MMKFPLIFGIFLFFQSIVLTGQGKILTSEIRSEIPVNYFLYLPEGYASGESSFPLLLFLHGGGESGSDTSRLIVHGPPKLVREGRDFPFIILAPQNGHPKKHWEPGLLAALLDRILEEYRVDESRIYLTGLSRGGYGAWSLAMNYPDYFAAMVPICGAVPSAYAGWVPDIPIWIFHGQDDTVIPMQESLDIYENLKARDRNVKLTIYPETGHDSWTRTYEDPALYEWLLKQKK